MVDKQVEAVSMWTNILLVLLSVVCMAYGEGEYIVTHTPSHVTFQSTSKPVLSSEISKVVASTFGFTVDKDLTWDGLGQTSLFARPKANVIVSVEGAPRSLNIKHHMKYQAENDDASVSTASVATQLQTNMAANPLVVDFSTDNSLFALRNEHPELFSSLPSTLTQLRRVFAQSDADTRALNATQEADLLFLGELHVIEGIMEALRSNPELARDSVPDLYHLRVQGVQRLVDQYGETSQQVRDAMDMLEVIIDKVTAEFRRLYSDNLIIQVVTSAPTVRPATSLSRRARSLLQAGGDEAAETGTLEETLNVAKVYTDMYPIIFNIMLWGGIAYALVIISISYGIWFMDPGKDSIIYRMTSNRKKDS